jgi:D-alanyl-D-alanine carboxypeptidase
MYRVSVGASVGLRWTVSFCLAGLIAIAMATSADARWRKRSWSKASASSITSEAKYADIVVDANSGDVLHAMNADSPRYPASLTKVMTLYLLFERIEAGRLKLESQLEVSANASEQAPSKLGLKPGQTISVEEAIKALVTKSANDVAVVIAEALAGSEEEFAKLMTRKARALGMSRTTYKNASGLPDDDQVTTARDQALLALAIQERFPRYYAYFKTPQFVYRGHAMRNHNHLLGRVDGVDGIKTGYTRMSGFNLITSVRRGPRHVVAVVFGGRSASQRDARMESLIEANFNDASAKRTAPKIQDVAEAAGGKKVHVASADETPPARPASSGPLVLTPIRRETPAKAETTAAIPVPRPAPGSTEPIKPLPVKTLSVKPGAAQATMPPVALLSPMPVTLQAHASAQAETQQSLPPPPPGARPGVLGVLPAHATPEPKAQPQLAAADTKAVPAPATSSPVRAHGGWIVQVGAFDDEAEARQRLNAARSRAAKLLGKAEPFTETVAKGDKTLYRARFAGLDQADAEAACRQLKKSEIVCMAIRN